MNCEVVAIGTELLLGPSVDTNSAWIGERLAENGINSFFHTVVGDNHERIVEALRFAVARSDSIIVGGGLGPTQDDITREAMAEVMGVGLVLDEGSVRRIEAVFERRGTEMSANNLRQAYRPEGSSVIEQSSGTAPGLICPIGDKVVYLLPGVPHEMKEMMERVVLADLRRRSNVSAVIASRFLRTWGLAESKLAEILAPRIKELDANGSNPTIAFLAQGIEGIQVRVTARAETMEDAKEILAAESSRLARLLGQAVFGIDDEPMEAAVGKLLVARKLTLAVAESLTGGLIMSRLTSVPGASEWIRGGVVSYAGEVKFSLLHVPEGPVVTPSAARAMADGVRDLLGADVGLGITGVAGPTEQEGQRVGTVFGAIALPWKETQSIELHLGGDRTRIREMACINLLDALRRSLTGEGA